MQETRRNPGETMHSCEGMNMLFAKIKSLDPENASKIMGYLLIQGLGNKDLIQLASSPHSVLLSVVLRAKSHLRFSSTISSALAPSPFNPIARPSNSDPCSEFSHRKPNNGLDSSQNLSSPSSTNCWSPHGFRSNPTSPKPGTLPSQMQPLLVEKNGGGNAGVGPELVNDRNLHRGSSSASEIEGVKTCYHFARGFCKYGSNCKFFHGDVADSRASAGPVTIGEDFQKLGLQRNERIDFLSMSAAAAASRLVYFTFPSYCTFKEIDVLEYFSRFGPVQDVKIPYQQKRMFGFVTFAYPETVKIVLAKGNPHFVCNSPVLVKPYKDKGEVLDKRQSIQPMSQELGEVSQSQSPNPIILNHGGKMLHDSQDMLFRRSENLHVPNSSLGELLPGNLFSSSKKPDSDRMGNISETRAYLFQSDRLPPRHDAFDGNKAPTD